MLTGFHIYNQQNVSNIQVVGACLGPRDLNNTEKFSFFFFQFRTKTIALGSWPITDMTSNFKDISLTKGIRLSLLVEVWSSLHQPRRINGNDIAHVLPIS